jgi:hypothetical protein
MKEIARSLEEGWDYSPAWRCQVAEQYLVEGAGGEDPLQVLADENDSYVRQFYLLRRTGHCHNSAAFLWAHRCHAKNQSTGAASLLKALVVAKAPLEKIAEKLRTTRKNVMVFMKLYFDIARYATDREWLGAVIFSAGAGNHDLATLRERRWLAAAYLNGQEGLERSLSRKITMTPGERDQLTAEIRGILTVRTHEFVADLQNSCAAPSGDDFDRLVRMLDTTARQPLPDNRDDLMQTFIRGLHGTIIEKAKRPENANDPVLQELLHAGTQDSPEAQE